MSTNCPVCYECYGSYESHEHAARKLLCGDFICHSCVVSEIFDDTYYCPECGRDFHGKDLSEFSEYVADPSSIESLQDNNVDGSPSSSASNLFDSSSYDSSSYRENRRLSVRLPCTEPGCKNKAIAASLCMFHASLVANNIAGSNSAVVKESKIAKNMEANSDLSDIYMSRGIFEKRNKQTSVHPDDIINKFKNQQRIELGEAMEILNTARNVLSKESNILRIEAPVIAVGDIHGQFYDLLNLLEEGGKPSDNPSSPQYLFLGDYVDRGSFSCEVIFTLLALKIAYPDKIHLLRGNHESGSVSSHFGFKQECKRKYGVNVYHRALLVFQTMPIGAIISTAFGDIYACHGGLSPSLTTIEEIDKIDRFIEPEMNSGLLDILWSDPISDSVEDMSDDMYEEFLKVSWKPNPSRGCSYCFGYNAVKEFLNKNGLVCIVRAHEVQADGFRRHFEPKIVESRLRSILLNRVSELADLEDDDEKSPAKRPSSKRKPSIFEAKQAAERVLKNEMISEKDFPPVITIFSAPNYCDRYGNKAAILHIDSALDGFRVIQYDCVEHPIPDISDSQTDNYMDAIIVACPYMPSSFREFVKLALQLGPDETLVGELERYHSLSKGSVSSENIDSGIEDESGHEEMKRVSFKTTPTSHPEVKVAAPTNAKISAAPPNEQISIDASTPKPAETSHATRRQSKRRSLTINIVAGDNEMTTAAKGLLIEDDEEQFIAGLNLRQDDSTALQIDVTDIPNLVKSSSETPRRRSADSVTQLRATPSTPKRALPDTYMQALASDSINEVHPEALTSFIQGAMNQKFYSDDDKAIQFQFPQKEMAAVSVTELRKRFEKAPGVNVFSEFDTWRINQANLAIEEAAKAKAAAALSKVKAARVTELDKCHRFDEIMAKFGGSRGPKNKDKDRSKNMHMSDGNMFDSTSKSSSRRKSAGTINTDEILGRDRSMTSTSKSTSPDPSFSKRTWDDSAHDSNLSSSLKSTRAATPRLRRATSFDPKLAPSMLLDDLNSDDDTDSSNHTPFSFDMNMGTSPEESSPLKVAAEAESADKEIVFTSTEVLALRLMFSMFDRSGSATIEYEDLVAYAQETDDMAGIRDADIALDILDIDGDGKIGLLDFIHFASRLKKIHQDRVNSLSSAMTATSPSGAPVSPISK